MLIDKNLPAVLRLADSIVVLDKGRSVWAGSSPELAEAHGVHETYQHL